MAWMCIGIIFIIIFGLEILYAEVFVHSFQGEDYEEVELEGHPVRVNTSGAIIPVVCFLLLLLLFSKIKFALKLFR